MVGILIVVKRGTRIVIGLSIRAAESVPGVAPTSVTEGDPQ